MDMGPQFHSNELHDIYRSELGRTTLKKVRGLQDMVKTYRNYSPSDADFIDGMSHAAIGGIMDSHRNSEARIQAGHHPMDVIAQHTANLDGIHQNVQESIKQFLTGGESW